jgi:hypothetical protein
LAVTFHWDLRTIPETRSAWPFYANHLHQFAAWAQAHDHDLIGHWHPRLGNTLKALWQQAGVEVVADSIEVLARATLLAADNTSLMYEAASLDIPVLALELPAWRRNITHGLRFWDRVPGNSCPGPVALAHCLTETLDDRPLYREMRRLAATTVYAYSDGKASERAADAVMGALRALS